MIAMKRLYILPWGWVGGVNGAGAGAAGEGIEMGIGTGAGAAGAGAGTEGGATAPWPPNGFGPP